MSVNTTGNVDTNTAGTYTISYSATDSAGNTVTKVRSVTVVSNNTSQDNHIDSLNASKTNTTLTLTLQGNVLSGSYGFFFLDSDHNTQTGYKTRGVGAEYLVSRNYLFIYTGDGSNWSWKYIQRIPVIQTAQNIIVNIPIDTITVGNIVNIVARISGGGTNNTTPYMSIKDNIIGGNNGGGVDRTPPVITLNGAQNITLTVGDRFGDAGATATDDRDGTVAVTVSGSVDTSKAGTYTLTYTATDTAGNTSTVTRTVTVNEAPDTQKPVINLHGGDVTLTVGDTYTELATANDNKDGDITANIVRTGSVDTNTAGSYTLTYNVTDTAGNIADTVTRIVTVVDNTSVPVVDANFSIDLTQVAGYSANDPIEDQYLSVINYLRGLHIKCNDPTALEGPVGSDLVWNTFLTDSSQEHSEDMLSTGIFTHEGTGTRTDITGQTFTPTRKSTPFERMTRNGYSYITAGENIAYRAAYPTLPNDAWVRAMEGWMTSHTGHCSNIMNPDFIDFGMAESRGTRAILFSDGVTRDAPAAYWTQNFGAEGQ